MKKFTKIKTVLVVLGIIFAFSLLSNINFIYHNGESSRNLGDNIKPKLKKAGYWDLTGSRIYIDDNNPLYNWVLTTATYDWCDGSGTWNDPYIIENVTINGQPGEYLISVLNSDVSFIIRNCTLNNGHTGINLESVENGMIINNTCSSNSDSGLVLSGGQNNTIISNIFTYSDRRGVAIFSNNNTIKNNIISFNDESGIHSSQSDINIIKENKVYNNTNNGIIFYQACVSNIILKNSIYNNENGILLESSGHNDFNRILENNVSNNDYGIYFKSSDSDHNTISDNNIKYNIIYGILVVDSTQNSIYKNTLIENTINAYDSGTSNQWDYASLGNYWDNYGGSDANDDGIGDTAYDVPPLGGSVDNYPIWEDGDDVGPNIIINSPNVDEVFGFDAPEYNITVIDQSINTTWYTIDGGIANFTFTGNTGFVNQTAWDNEKSGIITLRFYANDSVSNIDFEEVVIKKDVLKPNITINSPTPYQICGVDAPTFSLTIVEPNLLEKRYSLNGRPNITFTTETQFSQTEWNNIGNGTVLIVFYIIDKAGNMNSSQVVVRKDANIPDITILSPIPDEIFGSTPPEFNISIIEEDLISMWYIIEGNLTQYPFTGVTGTISQEAWDHAIEGDVTITFYAQDRAGNIGIESVVVIKSIPSEPAIPFELIILISVISGGAVIGVATLLLIRRKRKRIE